MPLPGIGLLALLALTPPGAPASVPVRVEFEAPAGCADAEAFFSGVLSRASHVRRARPGEAALRLGVRLTRAGGRVHGELRLNVPGAESETRRVEGASCAEVVQVLSLTAALAVDPTADLREAPPRPSSPPSPAPTPESQPSPVPAPAPTRAPPAPAAAPTPPTPTPPPERAPEPPPSPPAEPPPPPPVAAPPEVTAVARPSPARPPPGGPRVGASVVAARVLSSSLALGGSLSGRFGITTRGGLAPSLALALLYLPGDFFGSGDDLGTRWAALAATACPGWGLGGRLRVEPCARLTGGFLSATDHSVNTPRTVDRPWGSAGALLRASAFLGAKLSLDVEAGVDFPFVTRRFITTTSQPYQAVGSTATASPTISVGLSRGL